MKKVLLIIFLSPLLAFTQTEKIQSKIESMSEKSGVIFKKEFDRVGDYYYGFVEVLTITNLTSNSTTKGVRIGGGKAFGYLDEDEIDGLIIAVEKMKEIIATPVPKVYTEYVFKSKSGFQASLFKDRDKWSFVIDPDKYKISSSEFFEKMDWFQKFYDGVIAAKKSL